METVGALVDRQIATRDAQIAEKDAQIAALEALVKQSQDAKKSAESQSEHFLSQRLDLERRLENVKPLLATSEKWLTQFHNIVEKHSPESKAKDVLGELLNSLRARL